MNGVWITSSGRNFFGPRGLLARTSGRWAALCWFERLVYARLGSFIQNRPGLRRLSRMSSPPLNGP